MTKTSWSSLIVIVIGLISIYIIYRAIYSQKEGYTDCFSYRADGTIGECDYGENNQELTQQQNGMASGLSIGSWSGGNVQPASEFIESVESGESIGQLFTTSQQDAVVDDSDRRQSATITQQRQQYSDNILAQSGITNVRGREGSTSKVKDNTSGSFLNRIGQTAQSVITSIFGDNSAVEDDVDEFGRPMENIGVENKTGAGGAAIIIDAITDNKNRTASEIRTTFNKNNGNLGTSGSVKHFFDRVGVIKYPKNIGSYEDIFEFSLEIAAKDVAEDDESYEVIADLENYNLINSKLEKKYNIPISSNLDWKPRDLINVSEKDSINLIRLIEKLEEVDDVQNISSNFDIKEEIMEKIF